MTQKKQYVTNVDAGLMVTFYEPEIRDVLSMNLLDKEEKTELVKMAKRYLTPKASSLEKRSLERWLRKFWERHEGCLTKGNKGHGPEYIFKEILAYCI